MKMRLLKHTAVNTSSIRLYLQSLLLRRANSAITHFVVVPLQGKTCRLLCLGDDVVDILLYIDTSRIRQGGWIKTKRFFKHIW